MEATEPRGLYRLDQGAWGPISLPLVQLAQTGFRRLPGLETLERYRAQHLAMMSAAEVEAPRRVA